jgi:hypothetical protein
LNVFVFILDELEQENRSESEDGLSGLLRLHSALRRSRASQHKGRAKGTTTGFPQFWRGSTVAKLHIRAGRD